MATSLYIESTKGALTTRQPNLMPFHIGYSGPAPISTYFRVKSTPAPTFGTVTDTPIIPAPLDAVESQDLMDSQATAAVEEDSEAIASSSSLPNSTSASSSATLANDVVMAAEGLAQVSLQRHYIAAFRGRGMHGLEVDLPEGYSGLVLHAPDANERSSRSEEPARKKGKATESGRGGRTRAKKDDIAEDEEQQDTDMQDLDADAQRRALRPLGTFASFVLWHPDIPVDEGKDEYIRSLTEWTKLAAEVSVLATVSAFV